MLLSHWNHLGHPGKAKGKCENVLGPETRPEQCNICLLWCRWQMLLCKEKRLMWWEKVSGCELEPNRDRDVNEDGSRVANSTRDTWMWVQPVGLRTYSMAGTDWCWALWGIRTCIRETSRRPAQHQYLRLLGGKVGNTGVSKLGRALSPLLTSLKPVFFILETEILLFASKNSW